MGDAELLALLAGGPEFLVTSIASGFFGELGTMAMDQLMTLFGVNDDPTTQVLNDLSAISTQLQNLEGELQKINTALQWDVSGSESFGPISTINSTYLDLQNMAQSQVTNNYENYVSNTSLGMLNNAET